MATKYDGLTMAQIERICHGLKIDLDDCETGEPSTREELIAILAAMDAENLAELERRIDLMTEEYGCFLKCEGLPEMSADELAYAVELLPLQAAYLEVFIARWNELRKEENEIRTEV